MSASVADLLEFDALPEETRKMVDRVIAHRLSDAYDEGEREAMEDSERDENAARQEGYAAGFADGQRAATKASSDA